ncbi:MAG: RNA methyltransferase [Candidatus Cloacimonetes bacterium]|nr:RNA methyltransferase [Candidatus Cloacimonadota bacterium]
MAQKTAELSKNKVSELRKLLQKKYRDLEGRVVVEGLRTLQQLHDDGFQPLEQYFTLGQKPVWNDVPAFSAQEWDLAKICDSQHPQGVAALFKLPQERETKFKRAFYLDGISDPGNLGTIFRIAAAFELDAILLSPNCAEPGSPKVIRSSLGSVFKIPFQTLQTLQLKGLGAKILCTDASVGEPLRSFSPAQDEKSLIVLGSEAHGIGAELKAMADAHLRIEMGKGTESLNVAVAAGIIAHHLYISR